MYVKFRTTSGQNVAMPYGKFITIENDGSFDIYELNSDNRLRLSEAEFRKVEEVITKLDNLYFEKLNHEASCRR